MISMNGCPDELFACQNMTTGRIDIALFFCANGVVKRIRILSSSTSQIPFKPKQNNSNSWSYFDLQINHGHAIIGR